MAALVPIAMGAAIGGGIAYGVQVVGNVRQGMSLRESRTWTEVDWGAVGRGAFHGAVSAAAAVLVMPSLPGGGLGLRGIAETAVGVRRGAGGAGGGEPDERGGVV